MLKTLSTFAFIFAAVSTAATATPFVGCYERIYDAKHMKANPGQRVDSIQVQLGVADTKAATGGEEDEDIISLAFQGKSALYFEGIACKASGESALCTVGDKRGKLKLEPTARGVKMTFLTTITIAEEGMGGDVVAKIEPRFDNGVFALRKVSNAHCRKLFGRRAVQ